MKMSRAILFIGTIHSARYKSFHGSIRRILRPAESKGYRFTFSSELERGAVEMEILDRNKNLLLHLQRHEEKEVFLEKGKKYFLVLKAHSADGAHHMEWK